MLKYLLLFVCSINLFALDPSIYRKSSQKTYDYFSNKKVKKLIIYKGDSVFNAETAMLYQTTDYDKSGRPQVDSLFENMENDKPEVKSYKYNENGDLYEYVYHNYDLYPVTYQFVIAKEGKNEGGGCDGGQPSRFTFDYNKEGNMIRKTTFVYYPPPDDSTPDGIFSENYMEEFKYDKKYNLTETLYFTRSFEEEKLSWTRNNRNIKTYKKERIIKEDFLTFDDKVYKTITYLYDKKDLIKSAIERSEFDETKFLHYFYEYYDK